MNEHVRDSRAQPLRDPTNKYPKPPYKKQTQPWRDELSRLRPSAWPLGLITGSDSGIGRAAAIAFAHEGAALPGDLRDESFCNKLVADAIRAACR